MKLIKEYQEHTADLSGGRDNTVMGHTAILRIKGASYPLSTQQLATLFNTLAKDFPDARSNEIQLSYDHLEIQRKPIVKGYKKIPGKHETRDEVERSERGRR